MNYMYNDLFGLFKEKNFKKSLRYLLQQENVKKVLNTSDEKTKKLFEEPFSAKEIKAYLKKSNDTFKAISKQNRYEIMEILDTFENSQVIKDFFSDDEFVFSVCNSSIFFEDYYSSVFRKIIFENSKATLNGNPLPDGDVNILYDYMQMNRQNGSYVLELMSYFENKHYIIKFDNISVKLKAYKAESDFNFLWSAKTPWQFVNILACNINAHIKCGVANDKERKILGLVKHLAGEKYVDNSIPAELYKLIEKHRLKNVIKPPYDFSQSYLCKKMFEPLWRDIFSLISETQKDLPSYFEENISKEEFQKHKQLITEQMKSQGYIGTYPDFYKKDSVIKPVLYKTYGLCYVTAIEKHAVHHIRCYSFKDNEYIQTTFFVGTIFNKRENDKTDIYSTMFNCGGKAVFSVLTTDTASLSGIYSYEGLTKRAVKAAVKMADLKKADVEDNKFKRERYNGLNSLQLMLTFILFSAGFSLIVPLLLIILERSTISEVAVTLKSEPILATIGIVVGFATTFLLGLLDFLSSKK